MTIRTVVQSSFSGGQVDPSVEGRADVEGYKTAAARMENFMPTKTGSMRRRPGTIFCANAFDSYVVDSEDTADGLSFRNCNSTPDAKLIPFNDSTDRQSLLAVSPSIVNLLELGRPRAYDVGSMSFCPRILQPDPTFPNAQYDWNEVGQLVSDADVGQVDFETRNPEESKGIYDRPDTSLLKSVQVEDVFYLAPGGLTPMHACHKSLLFGRRKYTPSSAVEVAATTGNNHSIVNMPVGYLDGPYVEDAPVGQSGSHPGKILTGSWPTFVQDKINVKKRFFPICDRSGRVPLGIEQSGSDENQGLFDARVRNLGEIVLHVMNRSEANLFRRKFQKQLLSDENALSASSLISNPGVDMVEGDDVGLADLLNSKLAAETPIAIENRVLVESVNRNLRFSFHFMGAFSCPMVEGGVNYPGSDTTDDERELTVLVLRIAQALPQSEETYDIDVSAPKESGGSQYQANYWPYGLDGASNPPSSDEALDPGRSFQSARLKIGPDTMSGVTAVAQTQGRMHVAFKSLPGRIFSTKINGFSINTVTAGIEIPHLTSHSNTALDDRMYLDFGDSSVSDTTNVVASDGIQLLTVGDTGAKIRHLLPYKSQILVCTASATMAISPARGEVLTPTNAKLIQLTSTGVSRTTPPVVVDDKLYFVDSTDSRLTELELTNEAGTDAATREVSVASSSIITNATPVEGGGPGLVSQRRIRSMTLHQYPIQHLRLVKTNGEVGVFVCESTPDIKSFSSYKFPDAYDIRSFAFCNDQVGSATFGIAKQEGNLYLFRETKEEIDNYEEGKFKLDLAVRLSTENPPIPPSNDTVFTEDGPIEDSPFDPPPPPLFYERVNLYLSKQWTAVMACLLENPGSGNNPNVFGQLDFAQSPYEDFCERGRILVQQLNGEPIPADAVPVGRKIILQRTSDTNFDTISSEGGEGGEEPLDLTGIELTISNPLFVHDYISGAFKTGTAHDGQEEITARFTEISKAALGNPRFDPVKQSLPGFKFESRVLTNLTLTVVVPAVAVSSMTANQQKNARVPHLANRGVCVYYQGTKYTTVVDANGDIDFASIGLSDFPEGAIVGLPYTSRFKSLPLQNISANKGQGNDPRSDIKRVYRVNLHVFKSYGGRCGVDKLDELIYSNGSSVATVPVPVTEIIEHQVQDDGGKRLRRVVIETDDIYQFELQAMHAEIDKGGM